MADKKETLIFVANKLNEAGADWALIGSANLALQGMDVAPGDIDILVNFSEKEKIESIFSEEEKISDSKLKNGEGEELTYLIGGVEVQFCFEYAHGFYADFLEQERFEIIELGSQKIPCLRLEDEAGGYEYLGKYEKAEEIREFLRIL